METKHRKVMVYEFKHDAQKGVYGKFEIGIGDFMGFGIDADEDAHASFSTAIIEMPDGTVMNKSLNLIRFLQDHKI